MDRLRGLFLVVLLLLPSPAPACSLCGTLGNRISLVQEFENARAVVYGRIANATLDLQPGGIPGKGTTEFHIEKIIKDDPGLPRQKMILLSRYLPILDPKDSPRYVMFIADPKKNPEPYTGRQLASPAVLEFLVEYQRYRDDPAQSLRFAAKNFDHADPLIAEEAFLLFARGDDRRIGQLARELSPQSLRKLVQTPDLEPERLSMFAFLLGACGDAKAGDVDLLRSLLEKPGERQHKSFEGILAGYITMQPREGWAFARDLFKDEKNSLLLRYAALRAMRFFHNARADEYGPQVLEGLGLALLHSDLADIAIQDLRKWKRWDHTKLILSCYDRKSHQSPIVKNSIIRYALACPMPEARTLIERIRRQDPELIRYHEEVMMMEN